MYRNFKITEEEKKQIMEMHKNHGYNKPVNEQEDYDDESDNEEENHEMKIGDLVFFSTYEYKIDVFTGEGDSSSFTLTQEYDGKIVGIEIDMNMSDIYSDEQLIEFVKQKAEEGHFRRVPHFISYSISDNEINDFS